MTFRRRRAALLLALLASLVLGLASLALSACNGKTPTPPPATSKPTSPTKAPTSTPTSGPLPDLKITDVRVDPKPDVIAGYATLVRGTTYLITFEVSNVGKGSVPGAVAVSIDYGCQGPGVGATGVNVVAPGPIGPGDNKITNAYSFSIPVNKDPGTCTFAFKVDPDNIYQESDESPASNTWKTTVAVH